MYLMYSLILNDYWHKYSSDHKTDYNRLGAYQLLSVHQIQSDACFSDEIRMVFTFLSIIKNKIALIEIICGYKVKILLLHESLLNIT